MESTSTEAKIDQDGVPRLLDVLRGVSNAAWWIDNRHATCEQMMELLKQEMADPRTEAEIEEEEELATVRPEKVRYPLIAEIRCDRNHVCVSYGARNDALIEICRALNYHYSGTAWELRMDETQGEMVDRIAEVAHRLVSAGFVVSVSDAAARQKLLDASYTPVHTRWVFSSGIDLVLRFGRDDRIYKAASTLPGARWRDHALRVSPSAAVLDFADRYGFRITSRAQAEIDKTRQRMDAALVAPTVPAPVAKIIEQLQNQAAADIAPEFRDA